MSILDAHRDSLAILAQRSRTRALIGRCGHDFASNDYLGLAGSDEMRAAIGDALARGVAIGAGGSRLLRGNDPEHEMLEAEAAALFGSESCLWFSTGFAANSAIFSTLPAGRDLIVHDELIHASAHEGMKLSRATAVAARHNDVQAFADAVGAWRAGGQQGPRLDCGRKSLQHGRRHRAACTDRRTGGAGGCVPDHRRSACDGGLRAGRARARGGDRGSGKCRHPADLRQGAGLRRRAGLRAEGSDRHTGQQGARLHLLDRAVAADGGRGGAPA